MPTAIIGVLYATHCLHMTERVRKSSSRASSPLTCAVLCAVLCPDLVTD